MNYGNIPAGQIDSAAARNNDRLSRPSIHALSTVGVLGLSLLLYGCDDPQEVGIENSIAEQAVVTQTAFDSTFLTDARKSGHSLFYKGDTRMRDCENDNLSDSICNSASNSAAEAARDMGAQLKFTTLDECQKSFKTCEQSPASDLFLPQYNGDFIMTLGDDDNVTSTPVYPAPASVSSLHQSYVYIPYNTGINSYHYSYFTPPVGANQRSVQTPPNISQAGKIIASTSRTTVVARSGFGGRNGVTTGFTTAGGGRSISSPSSPARFGGSSSSFFSIGG